MNRKFSLMLISIGMLILISVLVAGCYVAKGNEKDAVSVKNQQQLYSENQPIPVFEFSLERDIFIQLYNLRNEAASTYTVVRDGFGSVVFDCPSIGYPLAADVQLTNPLAPYWVSDNGISSSSVVVEQQEPNGLYSSKNTAGTWVMCVLEDGSVYPFYAEGYAYTWPFPVTIDENGRVHPAKGARPAKQINIKH